MSENNDKNNETILECLPYPDFGSYLDANKVDQICKETKKAFKHDRILSLSKMHFIIYFVACIVSIALVIPHKGLPTTIYSIFMSLGTGGISASILAFFIERSDFIIECERKVKAHNTSILNIHNQLWLIFANHPYTYLKRIKPENVQQIAAKQSGERAIAQYRLAISAIEWHILDYAEIMSQETLDALNQTKEQLVRFIASIESPINTENLITVLEGSREWLAKNWTPEFVISAWKIIKIK